MRIIAGDLGGRTLRAPRGDATRPTSDKVRQATFNIIGPVAEAVLDVYAGSGALGFEALSRGAQRVVFIDSAAAAVRCIEENARVLGVTAQIEIIRADAVAALARIRGQFGLVFVDPPYAAGPERVLATLAPLVLPGGVVVAEHDRRGPPAERYATLALTDRRRYGDTELSFYRSEEAPK